MANKELIVDRVSLPMMKLISKVQCGLRFGAQRYEVSTQADGTGVDDLLLAQVVCLDSLSMIDGNALIRRGSCFCCVSSLNGCHRCSFEYRILQNILVKHLYGMSNAQPGFAARNCILSHP